MNKILVSVLLAFSLAACASGGNEKVRTETMDSVGQKVQKGVTTSTQVKAMYGEPASVSLTDGGNEVWNYSYSHATIKAATLIPVVGIFAGGSDVNKNEVVFLFDSKGVLQNYTVHASQTEVHNGGQDVGAAAK
jgi:hypothetical protein